MTGWKHSCLGGFRSLQNSTRNRYSDMASLTEPVGIPGREAFVDCCSIVDLLQSLVIGIAFPNVVLRCCRLEVA